MLWFSLILGLNFVFFCFRLIIILYHSPKQREIKFKPGIKLNHNIDIHVSILSELYMYWHVKQVLIKSFCVYYKVYTLQQNKKMTNK